MEMSEYYHLVHAMQSAVAFLMERDPDYHAAEPKHLRVGLNNAMADHGALADLLIRKGIITKEEYFEATLAGARRELETHTDMATKLLGRPGIKFG